MPHPKKQKIRWHSFADWMQASHKKAQAVSLVFGVIDVLLLGIGMSFAMSDLSLILGSYEDMAFMIGIIIGVVGIILVSLAYPLYNRIVKKEREKIAPEIIRLTDELMK